MQSLVFFGGALPNITTWLIQSRGICYTSEAGRLIRSTSRNQVIHLAILDGILEEIGGETIISPSIIAEPVPASDSKPSPSWLDDLQATKARVKTSLYPRGEDEEELEALYKKSGVFMARWLRFAIDRCLYVTLNGYVGLRPGPMKVGDRTAMSNDSELLFLVRDKDAVHESVGETYLHALSGEDSWDRRNARRWSRHHYWDTLTTLFFVVTQVHLGYLALLSASF